MGTSVVLSQGVADLNIEPDRPDVRLDLLRSHPGEVLGSRPPPAQPRLPPEIGRKTPVPSWNREPDRAQLGQNRGLLLRCSQYRIGHSLALVSGLLAEHDGLTGFACYGRIPLTQSSYDLYWIAVAPGAQRKGLGRRLLGLVEQAAVALGGDALYVDTSGRAQYETTRAFYRACGYGEAARLVDFYAPGDDKIVFVKRLTAA